jgi:hypothetical protein
LLPIDVPSAREGEASLVKDQAFNAADVIDRLRAKGARTVVAILDACRNNPFARKGTRSLGGTRGLARMEAQGGVFIMFSAGAKQEALDRLSPNDDEQVSVFARNFLPLLASADMTLIDLAKETQERVRSTARQAAAVLRVFARPERLSVSKYSSLTAFKSTEQLLSVRIARPELCGGFHVREVAGAGL